MYELSRLDRRRFLQGLIGSVVAAGVPLPTGVEEVFDVTPLPEGTWLVEVKAVDYNFDQHLNQWALYYELTVKAKVPPSVGDLITIKDEHGHDRDCGIVGTSVRGNITYKGPKEDNPGRPDGGSKD